MAPSPRRSSGNEADALPSAASTFWAVMILVGLLVAYCITFIYCTIQSAVLQGRFDKVPYSKRLCPCGSGEIEDTTHVLLKCPLYQEIRHRYLDQYVEQMTDKEGIETLNIILSDQYEAISQAAAKFCFYAAQLRKKMLVDMVQQELEE